MSERAENATADFAMWIFLVTEVMFFGGLFLAYIVYRLSYPEGFARGSHHLNVVLGTANTAILISSSFTMALSVSFAKLKMRRATLVSLMSTILLGCCFLGVKGYEYYHKYQESLIPGISFRSTGTTTGEELFIIMYFLLTSLHGLHVLIGILVLAGLAVWLSMKELSSSELSLHLCGLYWHFVDIVWIFLFPMLYLAERSK